MSKKELDSHKNPLKKVQKEPKEPVENSGKKVSILFCVLGVLSIAGGVLALVFGLLPAKKDGVAVDFPKIPTEKASGIYSNLTGLPLAEASQVTAPAYCIQTPNGMDGARPQAGLNEAGVVFEAIAESGITRFAAIYQNPTSAIIGPIRSLRLYYLQWDTPFDCTIVHAGGAPDALQAVSHGYKDLTENYTYMYRGTYGTRRWNNLFTTSALLASMNNDRGYGGSEIKGFARMTPEESLKSRVNSLVEEKLVIYEQSNGKTSVMTGKTLTVAIDFGRLPNFNVRYNYNVDNNTYARSYASGFSHDIYACPDGDLGQKNPEDNCTLKQLEPSVVVAMVVSEKRASDDYHEDITTIGTGDAYVFQNGIAIKGSWKKASVADQIEFFDEAGNKIALAPGQTFIEAVPQYGSVEY